MPVLETMTRYWRAEHDRGRQWLYRRPSMTAGLIRGGIKVNVVPRRCEVEVDCRLPFGITPDDIRREVEGRLARAGLRRVRFESMPPVFERATPRRTTRWYAWRGPTPPRPPGASPT
jgi:acetylornithine deacetylase/succinyl-diaminopimelate desuccinylase-like protein